MPQKDGKGRIDPMMGASYEGATESNEQSMKEKKIVQMVEKMFARFKQAREPYDSNWVENYKFFRGKQWTTKRPSYRNSDVMNFIHSAIQTIVPIMTDSRPNIEAMPESPEDYEFAQVMTQLLRAKWDRDQFSQIVAEAIVDACIYGIAISEQPWDQDLAMGLGDYDFRTVDPLYCYPDPRSRDINDNFGQAFITAIPTDLAEVKRDYPDKAHLLKSDLSDIDMAKTVKQDMDEYRIRNATDNTTLVQGDRPADVHQPDQILVIEAWMRDESLIEEKIKEDDKDGKKPKYRTKKKYPYGRKIKIANKVLLEDDENPYLDGKFPFARLVDHILPREFFGEGEVDQLKDPQKILNKMISYAMDIIELMGNPIWKNPTGSGVFSDSIVNRPGLVMDYIEGQEPRREEGANVQPSIFHLFDRMTGVIDKISGVNDVTQGANPTDASGIAIGRLQEAAQTRIRLKSRNVEAWLTQVGQQFASRILQYYSIPRVVRITDDPETAKYFEVAIDEKVDEAGEVIGKVATITNYKELINPETGDKSLVPQTPLRYEIKSNLDIRITTGTTLPFAKAEKKQQAKELYQLGIYDEEDLLTDLEHPRKTSVLEKVRQRKEQEAQMMQAQMMAQQQGQAGPQMPQQPVA